MISVITFKNVSYKIGNKIILDNISLDIAKGSITGILGPNGAGKTTLLSLINGLHAHTAGVITVLDEKLPLNPNLRKHIGVVLQENALYEELTTFENLEFSASLYDVKNVKERIDNVLTLLKLSDRKNQIVRTLSGGLKRRVAIARSFIHDPELLIVDEPTLGVDAETRHAIWSHLKLLKSSGRTIIVATNYLDEAQALCDTVAVLKSGKLQVVETPEELLSRTGICIDVACSEQTGKAVSAAIKKTKNIVRIDKTSSGLSIFIKSKTAPKDIIDTILQDSTVEGFKTRAPDLAEVFKTL